MKKKIFIALALSILLVSLFAVVVSAKTITYEGKEVELIDNLGDPTWYTGDTALAIQDKESIVILKDSDGNMKAFPAYYVLKFRVTVTEGKVTYASITWADQGGVTYDWLNEKAGTSYESGNIYYIEFPYGITECFNNSIFGKDADAKPEPNVVEIVIPDSVTSVSGQSFRRMNSCKKITMSKNVTSLPDWAFCGSAALETVVFPEGSLLESTGNSFSGCTSLSSINIEACTQLEVLGVSVFNGCKALDMLQLPDSIEGIGSKAFYSMGEIELASDYLPKNLKKIGTHFFSASTLKNEVLYFPEGITDFSTDYNFNDGYKPYTKLTIVFLGKMTKVSLHNIALTTFKNGSSNTPLTMVFAKNTFDELNGDFVQGVVHNGKDGYISTAGKQFTKTGGTLTITLQNNDPNTYTSLGTDANGDSLYEAQGAFLGIFCGGEDVKYCYSVRNSHTAGAWHRFFTTEFDYDIQAHKTAGVHYEKIQVVNEVNCGYDGLTTNTCIICSNSIQKVVFATGKHQYTVDDDCTTAHSCTVCLKEIVAALAHEKSFIINYEKGYLSIGTKTIFCTNDGCKNSKEQDVAALFISVGYSASEYSKGSVVHTVIANNDAIKAYAENTGKTFEYGVVAAIHTDGKPVEVAQDGTISSKGQSIIAKMTNTSYTRIEIKLIGVTPGIAVNCNAYIVVDGKISYICEDEILDTAVSKTI